MSPKLPKIDRAKVRTTSARARHSKVAVRDEANEQHRTGWLASCAVAVDRSKHILQLIAEASGASAHFQSHPLQRAVRDVNTVACHAVFDLDARLDQGLPRESRTISSETSRESVSFQ